MFLAQSNLQILALLRLSNRTMRCPSRHSRALPCGWLLRWLEGTVAIGLPQTYGALAALSWRCLHDSPHIAI
nr:hypothetical protein Iba_chr14eCG6330 [Ipomoea batatas]